jgi:glycosyltransferase involved in cell wall biosynthesis
MKADCRVAVITRTKDRPRLLERCIGSLLAQDFDDWVHVIVNDCGDQSAVVTATEPFSEQYKGRLCLTHHATSKGMEAASNTGLRASQSTFVAFLDDDDTWDPQFLSAMVQALVGEQSQKVKGVVCQSKIIRENLQNGHTTEVGEQVLNGELRFVSIEELLIANQFTNNAFLFYRSAQEEIGFFNEELPVLGDWDFNIRFLLRFDVAVVRRVLARWHWREKSEASSDVNTVHAPAAPHDAWRVHLANRALRGDWLDGNKHLSLIMTLGTRLDAAQRLQQELNTRLIGLEQSQGSTAIRFEGLQRAQEETRAYVKRLEQSFHTAIDTHTEALRTHIEAVRALDSKLATLLSDQEKRISSEMRDQKQALQDSVREYSFLWQIRRALTGRVARLFGR